MKKAVLSRHLHFKESQEIDLPVNCEILEVVKKEWEIRVYFLSDDEALKTEKKFTFLMIPPCIDIKDIHRFRYLNCIQIPSFQSSPISYFVFVEFVPPAESVGKDEGI